MNYINFIILLLLLIFCKNKFENTHTYKSYNTNILISDIYNNIIIQHHNKTDYYNKTNNNLRELRAKKKIKIGQENQFINDGINDGNYKFSKGNWITSGYSEHSYYVSNRTDFNLDKTPLRTYIDMSTIYNQKNTLNLNNEFINTLKYLFEKVSFLLYKFINIPKKKGNLIIKECNKALIYSKSVTNLGVSADLVLFPFIDFNITLYSLVHTNDFYFGYSKACVLEDESYRPIAGYIGLTPNMNFNIKNWETFYINLIMHQVMHIIAFDIDLFPYFYYLQKYSPYNRIYVNITESNQVIDNLEMFNANNITNNTQIKINRINNKDKITDKIRIISPEVDDTGKYYYKCNNFSGVLMDKDGKHWDKTYMNEDIMVNSINNDIFLSKFTLSFLKDTEWYDIDDVNGGLFRNRIGSGCNYNNTNLNKNYLNKECHYNIINSNITNNNNNNKSNYIKNNLTSSCSETLYSRVLCEYDNISNSYLKVDYYSNNYYFPSSCKIGAINLENTKLSNSIKSKISYDSACFMSSLINNSSNNKNNTVFQASCLEYTCNKDKTISIIVDNYSNKCNNEGDIVFFENLSGYVICPNYYKLCSQDNQCYDIETCIYKRSKYKHFNSFEEIEFESDELLIENKKEYNNKNNNLIIGTSYTNMLRHIANTNIYKLKTYNNNKNNNTNIESNILNYNKLKYNSFINYNYLNNSKTENINEIVDINKELNINIENKTSLEFTLLNLDPIIFINNKNNIKSSKLHDAYNPFEKDVYDLNTLLGNLYMNTTDYTKVKNNNSSTDNFSLIIFNNLSIFLSKSLFINISLNKIYFLILLVYIVYN